MKHLLQIDIDGYNERSLRYSDIDAICEEKNLTILELDVKTSFFFTCEGRHFIVIKKGLRGLKKLFTIFHEIGHFYLHGGRDAKEQAFFFGLLESKNEVEADAFATIAICPINALKNYDFLEEYPRSRLAKLIYRDRQKLWFLYGI